MVFNYPMLFFSLRQEFALHRRAVTSFQQIGDLFPTLSASAFQSRLLAQGGDDFLALALFIKPPFAFMHTRCGPDVVFATHKDGMTPCWCSGRRWASDYGTAGLRLRSLR
jgi:hypothetical protein